MYVHVNCFDYDKLLNEIVVNYEMGDQEVSTESIGKIFTDLSKNFNADKSPELTPEQIELVESVLSANMGWRDYAGETAAEFFEACGEGLQELIAVLQDAIAGPSEDFSDQMQDIHANFVNVFGDQGDLDDGEYTDECLATLGCMISAYIDPISGFNEGQIDILRHIEDTLLPHETLIGFEIADRPGRTVKYGDSLITFPTILIKVSP